MILLFKRTPKCHAEVLSSLPKYKKHTKICVFHKLCSSLGYSVVDHEFNVNDSIIYIKEGNKVSLKSNTCETKLCIDWLMKI